MKHKHVHSFDLLSRFDYYMPTYSGVLVLLLLLLAGTLLGMLVMSLLVIMNAGMANTYGMLIVYPIQFIPAMIYASAHSYPDLFEEKGIVRIDEGRFAGTGSFHHSNAWLLAICVIISTVACAIVTEPLITLLPEMPQSLKEAMKILTGGPLWVALLSTAVFAPFFEEWLCRGMVLRGLLQKMHPAAAIAISAAFFAVIHMNLWQALPAFLLGCLFGLVYYKTGSLKLTMLMHATNNAFSVFLTRIPGSEDAEYIWQIMPSKTDYGIIYVICLALLSLFIYSLATTEFSKKQ